jgi:hypothetical protein
MGLLAANPRSPHPAPIIKGEVLHLAQSFSIMGCSLLLWGFADFLVRVERLSFGS